MRVESILVGYLEFLIGNISNSNLKIQDIGVILKRIFWDNYFKKWSWEDIFCSWHTWMWSNCKMRLNDDSPKEAGKMTYVHYLQDLYRIIIRCGDCYKWCNDIEEWPNINMYKGVYNHLPPLLNQAERRKFLNDIFLWRISFSFSRF